MTEIILVAVLFSLEVILFYFMPTFNGKDTLFGLVLEKSNYLNEGLPILKRFRRDLLLVFFLTILGAAFAVNFSLKSLPFIYIFGTIALTFLLFRYLRKSWRLREMRATTRMATSLKPRSLGDFTYFWMEICVVVLAVFPFVLLIYSYPQLPETVPVHWNAAGEVDRWAAKSFLNVFFPALLSLWLQIFWIILKQDIIKARFRVPAENAETVLSLKEVSLRASVGLIDWCRLIGGCLLASTSMLILSMVTSFPLASVLSTILWMTVILLCGGIGFFIYRMILVNREIKALTGLVTFQTTEEMNGWAASGLYYYNPDDTVFMLEKPGGMGYTVNFANKRAFVYLAMILSPMVFALLSVILMNK